MKVLVVNHTASVSGAERSLLTLVEAMPAGVDVLACCPQGPLLERLRAAGVRVIAIRGTAGSLKLHPVHTARTLVDLAVSAVQVRRAARRHRAVVVHANSIRAGLIAVLARALRSPPAVIHVRDVLPDGPATRVTEWLLTRGSAAVISNSAYTDEHFGAAAVGAGRRHVVHNPVDLERFRPVPPEEREAVRRSLGLEERGGPLLGVVAQLTPWKAQDDAVKILAGLLPAHPGAQLLLIGSAKFVDKATRFDNRAYVASLERLISDLGLGDAVRFLGERDDVAALIPALDVLLVPSWEEPFGRTVVEAMACGVAVAATGCGGPPEIVRDGTDGLLLEPRRPELWVTALHGLVSDAETLRRFGEAGRSEAERRFGAARHAGAVVDVYRSAVGQKNSGTGDC